MSRACAATMLEGLYDIKTVLHHMVTHPTTLDEGMKAYGKMWSPSAVQNILERNHEHLKESFYCAVEAQQDFEKALREQKSGEMVEVDVNWSKLMETLNFYFDEHPLQENQDTTWGYVSLQVLSEITKKFS